MWRLNRKKKSEDREGKEMVGNKEQAAKGHEDHG